MAETGSGPTLVEQPPPAPKPTTLEGGGGPVGEGNKVKTEEKPATPAPDPKPALNDTKPAANDTSKPESNGTDKPVSKEAPKTTANSTAKTTPNATSASTPNTTPAASGASTPSIPGTPPGKSPGFKAQFKAFSKFGDTKSDGKHLTLSQSDKWMKQAKVIDGKKITTTDTGIYFKKLKQMKLGVDDYNKFLEDLAKNKKVDLEEIKSKMASCGQPGLTGVSPAGKSTTVDRLTDTSRYTGAHKQRFDETGKGKGIAGRKDVLDNAGYVQGYQNKDSYSKTH